MSAATIIQAQDKGLRQQFVALVDGIGGFAMSLYAPHRGWTGAARHADKPAGLAALAEQAQSHSPALANELRHFASRG
jgi:hypothetical protein